MQKMKLVDFNTAKALQELGYDGEWRYWWVDTHSCKPFINHIDESHRYTDGTDVYAAPRLDDAAYFLRDKYGIFIDIRYARENIRKCGKWSWAYILKEMDSMSAQYGDTFYSAHDDALEAAVTKAIEIIQKQKQ